MKRELHAYLRDHGINPKALTPDERAWFERSVAVRHEGRAAGVVQSCPLCWRPLRVNRGLDLFTMLPSCGCEIEQWDKAAILAAHGLVNLLPLFVGNLPSPGRPD